MLIKAITSSYRNCIKYISEKYPDYKISYDINWDILTSSNIVEKVELINLEIIVYINASFFIYSTKDIYEMSNDFNLLSNKNKDFSKIFWTNWFEAYNYYMYPCLTKLNKFYQKSYMVIANYSYNRLNLIEDLIIRYLPNLNITTDLEYKKVLKQGSILRRGIYLESIHLSISFTNYIITGNIYIYMKSKHNHYKEIALDIKDQLLKISGICGLEFDDISCFIDYGPLEASLGCYFNKIFLNGGRYMERLTLGSI